VRTFSRQFTVAGVLLLLFTGEAAAQAVTGHTFHVFVRGVDAGAEEVTVMDTPGGFTLRGSGRLNAPLNLTVEYVEAPRADRELRPRDEPLFRPHQRQRH
jgi:hypothetical protein